MSVADVVLVVVATFAAGFVNAVAGGGSLVSFPAFIATGLSPLAANVTNTLALWPGYLGGAVSARHSLDPADRWLRVLIVATVVGAAAGAAVLLATDDGVFDAVVPFLVLLGAGLLAIPQARLARMGGGEVRPRRRSAMAATGVAGAYGAYFGGGLGVVLLATLSAFVGGDIRRLNAMKNVLSLVANTVALVCFVGFGPVSWGAVTVGAPASLVGGMLGGRLASRLPALALRRSVVAFSVAVGVALLVD
ncbi:MAG: sulfite exporter TauE/SafE family protein [Acidimicrobiia bacterium]|nr:sulfite exporter TauE/SafE family protein [Acidimicrobiia bacterium]